MTKALTNNTGADFTAGNRSLHIADATKKSLPASRLAWTSFELRIVPAPTIRLGVAAFIIRIASNACGGRKVILAQVNPAADKALARGVAIHVSSIVNTGTTPERPGRL